MKKLNINGFDYIAIKGVSRDITDTIINKMEALNEQYFLTKDGYPIISIDSVKNCVKLFWIDGKQPQTPTEWLKFDLLGQIKKILNIFGIKPENSIFAEGL